MEGNRAALGESAFWCHLCGAGLSGTCLEGERSADRCGPWPAPCAVFALAGDIALPTANIRENPEKEVLNLYPQTQSLL